MFSSVKVFSVTKARDRESLGERVTDWIRQRRPQIVSTAVSLSSDSEYHCFTLVVFYNEVA